MKTFQEFLIENRKDDNSYYADGYAFKSDEAKIKAQRQKIGSPADHLIKNGGIKYNTTQGYNHYKFSGELISNAAKALDLDEILFGISWCEFGGSIVRDGDKFRGDLSGND